MSTGRPLRADAARNRERLLAVAYEAFASDGLDVSTDELARRAQVGAGTIHRHFPTKDDLYRAVIIERLRQINAEGARLLRAGDPEGLFLFCATMVTEWGESKGLVDAFAGRGLDIATLSPEAESEFLEILEALLERAQQAGTADPGLTVAMVKALIVGAQAGAASAPQHAALLAPMMLNALRARPRTADRR